jgi:hypothetical protein
VTGRLVAVALMAVLAGLPVTILPSPFLGALAGVALAIGGAGALMATVPLATAGGALALIEYTLALAIARPKPDPITATTLGVGLVLLLALVHLASATRGATLGAGVLGAQARHWLIVGALGALGAALFTVGGEVLALALRGAGLPFAVAVATLGALLAVAGVIALVTTPRHVP